MRQSREAKAETHQAIVDQAARLFRERGIDGTSVGDIMQAARKTHGGFYRHFDTKEALLEAALDAAFAQMRGVMSDAIAADASTSVLDGFIDYYLADRHVADAGTGCPVAALSGDMARASDAAKAHFGAGVRGMIDAIAANIDADDAQRTAVATRIFAMGVGAVMIARATDPATADAVLARCRQWPVGAA